VNSAAELARRRAAARGNGAGIRAPMAALPDDELIACLVEHGQPRWSAELLRKDPALRLAAARFWVDVGDARKGDVRAKERVELVRESWARMRAAELIADDPTRGHARDTIIDPAELL
jgi:hypothetical protein